MGRVLDVKGLNGGYGSVQILYDIDLYVEEGEFVTIIGPNGCGKSTFIKTTFGIASYYSYLLQRSPSPRDQRGSRMPSSA